MAFKTGGRGGGGNQRGKTAGSQKDSPKSRRQAFPRRKGNSGRQHAKARQEAFARVMGRDTAAGRTETGKPAFSQTAAAPAAGKGNIKKQERTAKRSSARLQEEGAVKLRAGRMDYSILFLVLFLVGFGLVILYSTSSYKASLLYEDTAYWLKRQALFAAIGIVLMFVVAKTDYHLWKAKRWITVLIYIGTVGLLLATLLFGTLSNGSKRWIAIGSIRFQPSELAKITLVLFLAAYVSANAVKMRNWKGLIIPFVLALAVVGVVGIENLSTAIILLAISCIMIFVATPLYKPFLGVGFVGVAAAVALLLTQGYRMERVTTWLDPASSENGEQTMQGLYAIGSGGLFGKGLGQSMQKLGFLPEANNDMIFSIICEELGLFGAICVLALFFALLWRFMIVAINAADLYGSMIVVGIIAHIGIQVFINIAVATNTIPNTGIPLPFISYGGTSLVILLIEMGMVLSVSRYIRIKS